MARRSVSEGIDRSSVCVCVRPSPSNIPRQDRPEEEVVGVGGEAAVLEEAEEVVVLPVDVPADLDGRLELQQVGLRHEGLLGSQTQQPDFVLC